MPEHFLHLPAQYNLSVISTPTTSIQGVAWSMKNDRAGRNGVKRITTRAGTIVGTWQPHQPLGQSVLQIGVADNEKRRLSV
jgi:hypothetical protein